MSASSPRARKSLEPASDSAALRKLALKASATGRKSDQGLPAVASPQSLTQGDQPNLQHLMASNINRQYTGRRIRVCVYSACYAQPQPCTLVAAWPAGLTGFSAG